jgi:hypothetical protein
MLFGATSMVRAKNEPENVEGGPAPKITVPFGATSVPSKRAPRLVLPLVANPRKIGWMAVPTDALIDELKNNVFCTKIRVVGVARTVTLALMVRDWKK